MLSRKCCSLTEKGIENRKNYKVESVFESKNRKFDELTSKNQSLYQSIVVFEFAF